MTGRGLAKCFACAFFGLDGGLLYGWDSEMIPRTVGFFLKSIIFGRIVYPSDSFLSFSPVIVCTKLSDSDFSNPDGEDISHCGDLFLLLLSKRMAAAIPRQTYSSPHVTSTASTARGIVLTGALP
jgi:hypothetical protein